MQRIRRLTIADKVTDELLQLLHSGRYGVGDLLPTEAKLMETLGVGRSSVREGIQRLVSLGLVSVRPGRGITLINLPFAAKSELGPLQSLKRKRVDDLLAARRVLELGVVDMVVKEATEEDFDHLQAVVDDIRQRLDRGESVSPPAAEIHVELAHASRNWIMARMVQSILDILQEHGELVEVLPGWREQEYLLHQRLTDVLRTRDAVLARAEMERHLDISFEALRSALNLADQEASPGYGPQSPGHSDQSEIDKPVM